jgi:hypothetical protein
MRMLVLPKVTTPASICRGVLVVHMATPVRSLMPVNIPGLL